MALFEQLKNIPKVDLHINLVSSISTDLAFSITNEDIQELEDKMIQKNIKDYVDSLNVPISILKNKKNLELAINDLIDRLENNNVIYSELFLDLPLYNKKINEEKIIELILSIIRKRNYNMNIVLCLSSDKTKEENLDTLSLLEKYYNKGVNGVYFQKDKMTNLNDYYYIFDRLIKQSIPYILTLDSKVTNQDREIYLNAKRIIYSLSEIDEPLINSFKEKDIMLEFSLTGLLESNIIKELKNYFLYDLIKNNYLITLTSRDMTTLNTDILNDYCLLFNNCPITLHELYKVLLNNLINVNINNDDKNLIIEELKEKANLVL